MPTRFHHRPSHLWFVTILALSALLAACGSQPVNPTSSAEATQTALDATPSPSPVPSATSAPDLAVLVAGEQSDAAQTQMLHTAVQNLAQKDGLEFELRQGISAGDMGPNWKIVVALPPDPGLEALAASATGTQFVAIGISGLKPAGNLSVIGPQGWSEDQQAFLAGTIAAVTTTDWRTGVITRQDVPLSDTIQQAFTNGAYYFCGLCNPSAPPFVHYPEYVQIPAGAGQADQQAAVDELVKQGVLTIYVPPQIASQELLSYAVQAKVNLIGGETPPDDVRPHWLATVRADPASALSNLWPDLLAGKGGASLPMPIVMTDIQSDLFSPGRQRVAQQTLDDLIGGWILPGTAPDQ